MQAMTVVSIQDENLKGLKLGNLTPLKSKISKIQSQCRIYFIYVETNGFRTF